MPAARFKSRLPSSGVGSAATAAPCGDIAGSTAISPGGRQCGLAVSTRPGCCTAALSLPSPPHRALHCFDGLPNLGITGDIDPNRARNEQQRCQGSRKLGHDLHLGGQPENISTSRGNHTPPPTIGKRRATPEATDWPFLRGPRKCATSDVTAHHNKVAGTLRVPSARSPPASEKNMAGAARTDGTRSAWSVPATFFLSRNRDFTPAIAAPTAPAPSARA